MTRSGVRSSLAPPSNRTKPLRNQGFFAFMGLLCLTVVCPILRCFATLCVANLWRDGCCIYLILHNFARILQLDTAKTGWQIRGHASLHRHRSSPRPRRLLATAVAALYGPALACLLRRRVPASGRLGPAIRRWRLFHRQRLGPPLGGNPALGCPVDGRLGSRDRCQ